MILYLDTSLVVPLFTNEPFSADAKACVANVGDAQIAVSEWTATELVSALALKVRTAATSVEDARESLNKFTVRRGNFLWLLFERRFFGDARAYLSDFHTNLRANDAIHLAIASGHDAELCTRDRRQHQAAVKLGLRSRLI